MQNLNISIFLKLSTKGGIIFSHRKAHDLNVEVLLHGLTTSGVTSGVIESASTRCPVSTEIPEQLGFISVSVQLPNFKKSLSAWKCDPQNRLCSTSIMESTTP